MQGWSAQRLTAEITSRASGAQTHDRIPGILDTKLFVHATMVYKHDRCRIQTMPVEGVFLASRFSTSMNMASSIAFTQEKGLRRLPDC